MHELETFSLTNDISQKELKLQLKRLMPAPHRSKADNSTKECKDLVRLRKIYKRAIVSKNIIDIYSENNNS
ncbi:MAG TPA: hypothetical protein QF753_14295 [Victivallales bacterium]|nr:hypothetical protein [Victivallales bacterium]|tara:strand:+ start:469 stop:681 length:213 start_codon:yes stop_codon:yes gene_type:complete